MLKKEGIAGEIKESVRRFLCKFQRILLLLRVGEIKSLGT
jgi:hypothetical protein